MNPTSLPASFSLLPKAELHVHLEGSIEAATVCALAARHGVPMSLEEAASHYVFSDFSSFLAAFKWVTTFLRDPEDYALIADEFFQRLRQQCVVYAEVTLSIGVMLLRNQSPDANYEALARAAEKAAKNGLRVQWVPDAVRQFGPEAAIHVARFAAKYRRDGVVAFGIGGDELSLPASAFKGTYDFVAEHGIHRLIHAGETGGPAIVREALDHLGVERIGHGIGSMHDDSLMERLSQNSIPLELCPTSNLATGALGRQVRRESATLREHPLPLFVKKRVPVTLSTDDPAMFRTSLLDEYRRAAEMGMTTRELTAIARQSFEHAFLPVREKQRYLAEFDAQASKLGLLY